MKHSRSRINSNTWRASEAIRDMIFTGELAAGTDHLESELATRLGMSRTPVREATLILEGQGLLQIRPRKGVRIASRSPEEMDEIYEVITELECVSVARAAGAGHGVADLTLLEQTLEEMERALAEEDRQGWARADEAFHTELVRLGGNTKILSIVRAVNDQVRHARMTTLNLRPLPVKSVEDHRAVFSAIAAGDATLAREIHREHREMTRGMLVSLLQEQQGDDV